MLESGLGVFKISEASDLRCFDTHPDLTVSLRWEDSHNDLNLKNTHSVQLLVLFDVTNMLAQ